MYRNVYPITAIIGQEELKRALFLNAVNPAVGGVLIRGEKGTAKSTAVRGLGAVMPAIDVVNGCSYACDPDAPRCFCDNCRALEGEVQRMSRPTRVVTLPLNATEDRVAGGIDFNRAVKKGIRVLQPGLLAKAHRGILYVDEVNLLDDHIVDMIIDAAASGRNVIEREGISFTHAAHFILVGTMNPEEGELRPQLLDRFGLSVTVTSEKDLDNRAMLMAQREDYDANPGAFVKRYESEQKTVTRHIMRARECLKKVRMPRHLRALISELCTENNVAGHRADLAIEQAARALAAWRDDTTVSVADIQAVAPLALSHRKRDAAPPPPPPQPDEHPHEHDDPAEKDRDDNRDNEAKKNDAQPEPQDAESHPTGQPPPESEADSAPEDQEKGSDRSGDARERVFDVGETFKVKKFVSPKDRVFRRGSGRRSRTRVAQKQGRYVKSTAVTGSGDVALDATLRAAAPFQLGRNNGNGLAVVLRPEDVREKIREKRIGNFLLFVVDASGSMGARGRMSAAKGAVMSLLLDAYQKRDRVAMVSFRKDEAVVNLPPTASIDLAAGLLKEMPVGGRTPISAGLVKSYEVLRNYLMREPTARPIVVIITDGKSNVAMGEKKPLDEALELSARLSLDDRIRFIVVDTESQGLVNFGLAARLAGAMSAQYFKVEDLKADTLLNIVKGEV